MSVSESDLGGFATTDQDAYDEIGSYSSYDDYGDSSGPTGGLLSNNQAWNPAWATGVNPEYQNEQFIRDRAADGWSRDHLNSMGAQLLQDRAKTPTLAPHEQSIQNQIDVKPISFNQIPQSTRNNIAGILNQDYTGAQGEQYAHKGVSPNSFHYGVDKAFGVEGTLPPDASKDNAFKKAVDSGAGKVVDFVGDVGKLGLGAIWKGGETLWDGLTTEKANQADPVEPSVGNTQTTTPVSGALDDINKARYSAFKRAGTLGNTGPVGPDGTSFSPGRWDSYEKADQVKSSMNDGLMNTLTQAFNAKPNMANARQVAHSGQMATDALTTEDRYNMSKKQIVELINNRGTTSTIHAVGYEEYDRDPLVPSSYSPIYSPEDENLINLFRMKGFDAEDFRIYPQQQQNIKGGGQTSLGLPGSFKDEPLLSVTPGIDLMGAGIVGLGSALAKFGTKSVGEFVSKFGKDSFDMLKGMLSKSNETNLNKLANSPINHSDDILTVTEQGLMKPAMSNKFGLGTHTPKELGTINRNAPIQGENIYTNSKILGNRNRLNANSIPVRARK